MSYEIKSKTRVAEPLTGETRGDEMEEVLVVFTAVETVDEDRPEEIIRRASDEIAKVVDQVKAERVLIYPYAHLSSELASPKVAVEILEGIESALSEGYEVKRSPFGYYKAFDIKCKGHPLSELSRDIRLGEKEEDVSKAVKVEEKIESRWYVLTPDGDLIEEENFDFSKHPELKRFAKYEITKARAVDKVPPHVALMQRLELVDYEPGSDSGNLRWYPKGTLMKRLLEQHVTNIVRSEGAMEVETPIMYDMAHPSLSKYLDKFPARQYSLKSDQRRFFLRFSACFGQYLMKHDMSISYRDLPLRLYELTHYSFRREQSGEVVGLRRLRGFTMPDMHTLVYDMDAAIEEFVSQYELCIKWMEDIGVNYEVGVRFVRSFFDENREFATELVKRMGKPVLVEMWDERSFYFVMKFEFNFVDALDKASALSTVQIDVENSERFDINFVDRDGQKRYPLMLHASISGAMCRNIYALLESAYLDQQKGKVPTFPLWLSPSQVRLCTVSDDFLEMAKEMADDIEARDIRVDVDDRAQSVGKKIRDAEREWIPYVVVLGEKEKESGVLSVRIRNPRGISEMSVEDLVGEIIAKTEGYPKRTLGMPRELSRRPVFRG
jgi:threonyl-tRNA synthetase